MAYCNNYLVTSEAIDWPVIFTSEAIDWPVIFTSDSVTSEIHWQIASRVSPYGEVSCWHRDIIFDDRSSVH